MKYVGHLQRGLPWAFGYIAITNLVHLLVIRDFSNFLWSAFELAICVLIAGPVYSLFTTKYAKQKHKDDDTTA